ncbi:MAG: hypothetical protein AB9835_11660 [Eubacteriales bacterium]
MPRDAVGGIPYIWRVIPPCEEWAGAGARSAPLRVLRSYLASCF